MSTGRDDLYRLIQSMSKNEKRYFKMEAKKAGDKTSNYIKLFNAVNEMEEYDEERLKKKLRREKFIDHLSAEKRYLYQNILRSLRNFRSDKSIYAQIKSMIMDSNYLIERSLYDLAERMLNKVEKLALKVDDQFSLLQINIIKRELVRTLRNKDFREETAFLIREKDRIFQILTAELEILDLYEKVGSFADQQLILTDKESAEELQKEMSILENYSNLDSPFLQLRRSQIKGFYFSLIGDLDESQKYRKLVVAWWDKHPLIKKELFYLYRLSLNNLIAHYHSTNQSEKVLAVLAKLESETPKNIHEQALIFQKVAINRLVYYLGKGKFDEALEMIPNIEEGLGRFKIPKASKFVLIANVAILFFMVGDHQRSLEWLNKIIKDAKSNHRLDVQRIARLLSIVNQIETGADYPVIDNFCRATNRFLNNSGLKEKKHFEYTILSFLRKYINAPAFEQKQVLLDFKLEIEDQKNNPRTRVILGLDEFYLWVKNKLENKTFLQLIKEKRMTNR